MLNYITWTMSPTLIHLGPIEIRWYGLFFAIGFLIGYKIEEKIFKHDNCPQEWVDKIFIYTVIATILGSRLGHCFFYDWDYYSSHPLDIFKVWEGGLASHGGALGIIVAMILYSKRVTHLSPIWALDRLVVPTALVAVFIRMGNLMNHEIYGHATTFPWGFSFIRNIGLWMQGAEPVFSDPSHPTQIYEGICYLITFLLLMYMFFKKGAGQRKGLLFGTFLIGIFLSRFMIEFVKNVQESFEEEMILKMGQWLSLPFILYGIYLVVHAMRTPPMPPLKIKK